MKKYYLKVYSAEGNLIFNHKSNNADYLINLLERASYDCDGILYANCLKRNIITNIEFFWERIGLWTF